jgi:predicted nucleic acid-binding protein
MNIYLDTSTFNHYFHKFPILHHATVQLFKEIKEGRFKANASVYVLFELERAKQPKRENMINLLYEHNVVILPENDLAIEIANDYIIHKAVPRGYRYDALHIAMATVYSLDAIISLNFKHMARDKTRTISQSANMLYGFPGIDIKSPMDVITEEIDHER